MFVSTALKQMCFIIASLTTYLEEVRPKKVFGEPLEGETSLTPFFQEVLLGHPTETSISMTSPQKRILLAHPGEAATSMKLLSRRKARKKERKKERKRKTGVGGAGCRINSSLPIKPAQTASCHSRSTKVSKSAKMLRL